MAFPEIDPDTEDMVSELVADNRPVPSTSRRLVRIKHTPWRCASMLLVCHEELATSWFRDFVTDSAMYFITTIDTVGNLLNAGDTYAARALARCENLDPEHAPMP